MWAKLAKLNVFYVILEVGWVADQIINHFVFINYIIRRIKIQSGNFNVFDSYK